MKLGTLIEQYIDYRKSLGELYVGNGRILRAFGRTMGVSTEAAKVRSEEVSSFLAGSGPITSNWHAKHNALLGFYRYAVSRGHVGLPPLPTVVPKRPPPFIPYIYSRDELRRLLDATGRYQINRSCMDPATVRVIVLSLYSTGVRCREVIALNRADVDLGESLLTVRQTKFFKTRLVPFGPQLCRALLRYRNRQEGRGSDHDDVPFFATRKGTRVNQYTLEDSFRRVCECAGVRRSDGARYQPRLHDLRHTFAVHRVISWYRQGEDVQKLLSHLSVYMGHVHLAATQVYLSMIPELLGQAGARFERYVLEGMSS